MPTLRKLLVLTACLGSAALTACDPDAATSTDYRVVLHADLVAMRASPVMAEAFEGDKLRIDGDLGPCGDLVRTASAVTVGADEGAFEVYVEGKFTGKAAKACSAHVADKLAGDAKKPGERVSTTVLGEGLLAIHRGAAVPSRARMKSLRDADPSPGKQAAWLVAHDDDDKDEVEHVEAWIGAAKGVDAHVAMHFDSPKAAAEIYAQATLGLTALRLSGDMPELIKAISISSAGDTLTAEFHASNEVVRKLLAAASVEASAKGEGEDRGASISVKID